MNCAEKREELIDLLLDEVEEPRAGEMRAHLESCRECAEELEAYGRVRRAVREIPVPEPSAEDRRCMVERVLRAARLRQKRTARSRRKIISVVEHTGGWFRRRFTPAAPYFAAASAAVLAIVVGSGLFGAGPADIIPPDVSASPADQARTPYGRDQQRQVFLMRRNLRDIFSGRRLAGGAVDLAGIRGFNASGSVHLVGLSASESAWERCVLVFTDEEWERVNERIGGAAVPDAELAMILNRKDIPGRIGNYRLRVPQGLRSGFLGAEGEDLTVLRFPTRTEIWSSANWDEYSQQMSIMITGRSRQQPVFVACAAGLILP